jgi:hypothetical protein
MSPQPAAIRDPIMLIIVRARVLAPTRTLSEAGSGADTRHGATRTVLGRRTSTQHTPGSVAVPNKCQLPHIHDFD